MTYLRHIYSPLVRRLSTCRTLQRPVLSSDYKSKNLWETRFDCDLLGSNQTIIKTINTKILSGVELNNLEVDVFINIAAPREGETAQLCEAVKTLAKFRRSLSAHTLLPSTSHAICRLFLDSNRLASLVRLLERRIEYGVFPDSFVMNIMFDRTLEEGNLMLASRLAALIMLQEEFGLNELNDNFALYSVSKYVESKPNFQDWVESVQTPDPILEPEEYEKFTLNQSKQEKVDEEKSQEDEDEEGEEDAEYIRIPFLRNPYNDNHFDLTNPREICGKTLSYLGQHLYSGQASALGIKCKILGEILQANWSAAKDELDRGVQSKVTIDQDFKEVSYFYIDNLHELEAPDAAVKKSITKNLDGLKLGGSSISQEAEFKHEQLRGLEEADIASLRNDIEQWSKLRHETKQAKDAFEERQKLIAEIKSKKEELRVREQYLYFYDDLKKRKLTRIQYD